MTKARQGPGQTRQTKMTPLGGRPRGVRGPERLTKMLLIRGPEEREVDQRTGAASALPKAEAAFVL